MVTGWPDDRFRPPSDLAGLISYRTHPGLAYPGPGKESPGLGKPGTQLLSPSK